MKEYFGINGKLRLIKRNKKTKSIITDKIIINRIMNLGLDELIKPMYSPNADIYLKYIAIGDDNTAVANDQEELFNEIFRIPVISRLRIGTGEFRIRAILSDSQPTDLSGICTIREIGTFGGNLAGAWNGGIGKDTGLMLSRIVLTTPEDKTDDEEIEFSWEYEISRN
jgi:hypothetical protein